MRAATDFGRTSFIYESGEENVYYYADIIELFIMLARLRECIARLGIYELILL